MSLNEQFYFLSPVQVVQVTRTNMQEVAEWCGGRVAETESRNPNRRAKGQLDPYVWVPTPEGTKLGLAFAGMYITKRVVITSKGELKVTWAVFSAAYFNKNYFETPDAAIDATWAKKLKKSEVENVKKDDPSITIHIHNNGMTTERLAREIGGALGGNVIHELPKDASL